MTTLRPLNRHDRNIISKRDDRQTPPLRSLAYHINILEKSAFALRSLTVSIKNT